MNERDFKELIKSNLGVSPHAFKNGSSNSYVPLLHTIYMHEQKEKGELNYSKM